MEFILFPWSHLVTTTEHLFWLNRYDGGWGNVDVYDEVREEFVEESITL